MLQICEDKILSLIYETTLSKSHSTASNQKKTMASFYLCVLALTVLFQQAKGGWLEEQLALYASPVTQPLIEATQKLEANLAELEVKKQELEFHKAQLEAMLAKIPMECRNENLKLYHSFFSKWDFDSCVNLTDDWKIGADLAMQGTIIVLNITETIGEIGNKILDCPSKKIYKVLPCYNENLIDLKNQIMNIRRQTMPFVHKSLNVAINMKKDFDKCVGIPFTIKDKIERHIQKLEC